MGAMKLFDGGVTPYSAPTQRRPQERLGGLRYSFDGLANVENEMSSLLLFATAIPPPVTLVLKMNLSLFMFCQGFITHIFFPFQVNGDSGSGGSGGGGSASASSSSPATPPPSTTLGENEMATMTDPDTLGPCEPGTAVKLEGIVHHVTDRGETATDPFEEIAARLSNLFPP